VQSPNNAYLLADAVSSRPGQRLVKEVRFATSQAVTAGQPLIRNRRFLYRRRAKDMADAELAKAEADLVRFQADAARAEAVRE